MGANHTERFGPGSLEQIVLIEAPAHHERYQATPSGHRQVRVDGLFWVYCGTGNEHVVSIHSPAVCLGCAEGEHLRDQESYEIAAELVNNELDDWFDPCDDDMEGAS